MTTATHEMIEAHRASLDGIAHLSYAEAEAAINAALAASPPTAVEPVAVKPLEWHYKNENGMKVWTAFDPFGHPFEHLTDRQGWWSSWRLPAFTGQFENQFKDVNDGKAAAQADYETRIRSALATPSTDHHEDFTAEFRQQHKELIEEAGKLREENERLRDDSLRVGEEMLAQKFRADRLSAENAALTERLERVEGALVSIFNMGQYEEPVHWVFRVKVREAARAALAREGK